MTNQSDVILCKVLEDSPIGVTIFEWSTGKRLFVNTALTKMFGAATSDDLAKRDISESWVNQKELERMFGIFQSSRSLVDFEAERQRVDGSLWWVLMNIQPVAFEGKEAGITWHIDITERKLAEQKQQESEQRFKDFSSVATDWFWESDENHRYTFYSDTFEEVTGRPSSDFLGKTRKETRPSGVDDKIWKQLLVDMDAHREFRDVVHSRIKPNGEEFWISTSGLPRFDETNKFIGYRGTGLDVSKIIYTAIEFERSQQLLSDAIESISEGFVLYDKDDRLVLCNRKFKEMHTASTEVIAPGISFEEIVRFGVEHDLYVEARGRGEPYIKERVNKHQNPGGVIKQQRTDGRWLRIEEQRTHDGGVVVIQADITDLVQAQSNIERFVQALDQVSEGLALWDAEGRLVFSNEALLKRVGAAGEELQPGTTYREWQKAHLRLGMIPEAIGREEAWLEERMAYFNNPIGSFELQREGHWYRLHVQRLPDGSSILSFIDIQDIKQKEESLRRGQRMEAVGQLTGGVAHDFNNLMGVMIGNAEMLKDQIVGNEKAMGNAEALLNAVDRGKSLTQRLLAFSRQQTLSPQPTAISALVLGLEDMLQRTLGETIEITTHLGSGTSKALIDPHQFEDALLNMAINSLHAMPKGGVLTIETSNIALDEDYAKQHEEVAPGDYVKVAVSDTGTGMSSEVLEKAFEPFFTTKEVGEGSGLGLSMVYGFIKQSKGHVVISSEVGEGATVELYLPRTQKSEANEDARDGTHSLARGSERILVVEDNEDVRDISTGILRRQGYEVVEAGDGKEAIMLLNDAQQIDLLFSDVVLPGGMNGAEIAEQAKQIQPNIKILFTTGYAEHSIALDDELIRGVTVITKPFRRAELLDTVRAKLDGESD